jgi:hypothetical protein
VPIIVERFDLPALEKSFADFVQRVTIDTSEKALREEVAKGFDDQPVVITDGVPRRDYHQVRPFGKIEFTRRPEMADAVLWALDALRKKSPVKTGRYVATHAILLNGAEIAGDIVATLRAVKETDRVQIVNPQPYAKKIEARPASKKRGITGQRGQSSQAPGGVYRVVLRALVQRYGRSMFFDFKYVKLNTGVKVWGYVGGKAGGGRMIRGDRKRVQRDHVYPALQFFIKPTGLAN